MIDYTTSAEKTYEQELKNIKPDIEEYKKARDGALSNGQVVEMAATGGGSKQTFYADANSLDFTEHKPTKERLDLLSEQTKKKYNYTMDSS
jgi:SYF2 splicing factor